MGEPELDDERDRMSKIAATERMRRGAFAEGLRFAHSYRATVLEFTRYPA